MDNSSSKQLIEGYFSGDEQSLELLINQHIKGVYNFVYHHIGSASEAEDLTQEVFIKAWKNIKKFDKEKNFNTWIFTIARNSCIDYLRKKKDVAFCELSEDKEKALENTTIDPSPLPEQYLDQQLFSSKLKTEIAKLPLIYRDVILLYNYESLNFREIAEITGNSLETIKSRHRRAIAALKELFSASAESPINRANIRKFAPKTLLAA